MAGSGFWDQVLTGALGSEKAKQSFVDSDFVQGALGGRNRASRMGRTARGAELYTEGVGWQDLSKEPMGPSVVPVAINSDGTRSFVNGSTESGNEAARSSDIRRFQELRDAGPRKYVIKPGDTVTDLFDGNQQLMEDFGRANNISNLSKIQAGQVVVLPDSVNSFSPSQRLLNETLAVYRAPKKRDVPVS